MDSPNVKPHPAAPLAAGVSDLELRAAFEHAPVGIAVLGEDCTVREANPAFATLIGTSQAQLHGATVPGLFAVLSDRRGDNRWSESRPLTRADDSVVQIEWQVVYEPQRRLYFVTAQDVGQREEMLVGERTARAKAESTMRLKDDFLATLAHELRNPLSTVLGWADVLGSTSSAVQQPAVQAIRRAVQLQDRLLSDLMDLSALLNGSVQLQLEDVQVRRQAEDAVEAARALAEKKRIQVELQAVDGLPTVRADAQRLRQMFWNLLAHAVQQTPDNGRVHATLERRDGRLLFRVEDNGRGIRAERLPELVERLRQPGGGTRGIGIGMAIVRELAQLHRAEISAHSPGPGQGATFTLSLPVGVEASAPGIESIRLDGQRILIVDDEADHRGWLVKLLADAGAITSEADSVEAALQQVEHAPPDVLISDIGMPGEDGYSLIRELRARGLSSRQLTAMALTAYYRADDRAAAFVAGFECHLAKPVEPRKLLTMIAVYSARRLKEAQA